MQALEGPGCKGLGAAGGRRCERYHCAAAPEQIKEAVAAIARLLTGVPDLPGEVLSCASEMPFKRMKVRLKKEIVTIGPVKANPNELVGEYVAPKDWNALIADPDVIVLDTRNDYEFRVGTFRNAIDPGIDSFSQFPAWVESTCTTRRARRSPPSAPAASAARRPRATCAHAGFEHVYHLKGGILKYLEEIAA